VISLHGATGGPRGAPSHRHLRVAILLPRGFALQGRAELELDGVDGRELTPARWELAPVPSRLILRAGPPAGETRLELKAAPLALTAVGLLALQGTLTRPDDPPVWAVLRVDLRRISW